MKYLKIILLPRSFHFFKMFVHPSFQHQLRAHLSGPPHSSWESMYLQHMSGEYRTQTATQHSNVSEDVTAWNSVVYWDMRKTWKALFPYIYIYKTGTVLLFWYYARWNSSWE